MLMTLQKLVPSGVLLLVLCPLASADYLYTVSFDQLSYTSLTNKIYTYAATSFSFTEPSIIVTGFLGTIGQVISVPGGNTDGFAFTELTSESEGFFGSLFVSPTPSSGVEGQIDGVILGLTTNMNGPGNYAINTLEQSGYCIDEGNPALCVGRSVTGSIDISEISPVPEPAALPLLASALALMGWVSHRKRRSQL